MFDSDKDGVLNEVELVQALGHLCVIREENLSTADESLHSDTHASSLAQDVLQQYGGVEVCTFSVCIYTAYLFNCGINLYTLCAIDDQNSLIERYIVHHKQSKRSNRAVTSGCDCFIRECCSITKSTVTKFSISIYHVHLPKKIVRGTKLAQWTLHGHSM